MGLVLRKRPVFCCLNCKNSRIKLFLMLSFFSCCHGKTPERTGRVVPNHWNINFSLGLIKRCVHVLSLTLAPSGLCPQLPVIPRDQCSSGTRLSKCIHLYSDNGFHFLCFTCCSMGCFPGCIKWILRLPLVKASAGKRSPWSGTSPPRRSSSSPSRSSPSSTRWLPLWFTSSSRTSTVRTTEAL